LVKKGAKGGDPNTLVLDMFEWAVKLIPDGKGMYYDTQSDWLIHEWGQMMQWKEAGYQGLDRDECPPQWAGIMEKLEGRTQGVAMRKLDERTTASEILEAAQLYAMEAIPRLEEDIVTPVDGYRQPEAPWA
jgi:hypothetical protein